MNRGPCHTAPLNNRQTQVQNLTSDHGFLAVVNHNNNNNDEDDDDDDDDEDDDNDDSDNDNNSKNENENDNDNDDNVLDIHLEKKPTKVDGIYQSQPTDVTF